MDHTETAGTQERLYTASSAAVRPDENTLILAWTLVSAALVGTITVAFILITGRMAEAWQFTGEHAEWRRALMPILGAVLGGYLVRRYIPEAYGGSVPPVKIAIRLNQGALPLSETVGKFIGSIIALASGISLGREGPALHMGAGVTSELGRRLGMSRQRIAALIPAGAAAGLAAAFNAPFAAVIFTLEVLVGSFRGPVPGYVLLSAVTSWIVMRALLGASPLFSVPPFRLAHPVELAFYGALGLAVGLASAAFVKLLLVLRRLFARLPETTKSFQPIAGGLVVGGIAVMLPEVLGVGYSAVDGVINGRFALKIMLLLAALKICASAASYSSGNPGGLFGPSIFIGGMLGGSVGAMAYQLSPTLTGGAGSYALVGMGAALAGILRAPLTSVVAIVEITRDSAIVIPLVLANTVSYFVSQRFQPLAVYDALLKQDGLEVPSAANVSAGRTVSDLMLPIPADVLENIPPEPRVFQDEPLEQVLRSLSGHPPSQPVPVAFRHKPDEWLGMITLQAVMDDLHSSPGTPQNALWEGKILLTRISVGLAILLIAVTGVAHFINIRRADTDRSEFQRGRELVAEGNYNEAIIPLKNSLSTPLSGEQRLILARTLVTTDKLKEATPYLQQLLSENPTSGPANLWMARIERKAGDNEVAQVLYNRAIYGTWPEYALNDRMEARWELAEVLFSRGMEDAAAAELLFMVQESKKDYETTLRVGRKLFEQGLPDRAANVYRQLLMAQPGDAAAIAGFGRALFASGEYALAARALETAVHLSPNRADLQREAGLASAIVKLNPLTPHLEARERAERFRILQKKVMESARACASSDPKLVATSGLATSMAQLEKRSGANTADAGGDLARLQEVWQIRAANCPVTAAEDEVLSLLFESKAFATLEP